jgi:flagellar motor switch protein FliN/FliY
MEKIRITAVEKAIEKSTLDTFGTMLSMDLVKVGKPTDPGLDENRFVASVHYAGEVVGTLSLHMSHDFAVIVTAAMLGMEVDEVDNEEELKDVLGELANIISGNLKSDFLDADLACVISTPSITRGSDFKIEASNIGEYHQWIYRHQANEMIIEITLKEDLGAKADIAGMDSLTHDEVRDKINTVDVPTTVINAVIDVFYTMLSMEIESIQEVPAGFREDKRTVGNVSFAGDVHGMFNIQVNDDFARTMTAAMLGMQEDEIESEEEVFDVIREMSNIIGGNLKSSFVDVGLSCVLSTPSITNGIDFKVEALNIINTQRFLFQVDNQTIIVDAGIKKDTAQQDAEDDLADGHSAAEDDGAPEEQSEFPNLDLIMEIPLELTVELGRTTVKINKLLKMGNGAVVGLNQLEGEPVDLMVNDTLIAKGEVLVENEKYGIRIVEVVSRTERVKSLS